MATAVIKKISAAFSGVQSRIMTQNASPLLRSGLTRKLPVIFVAGFMGLAYKATRPPVPRLCGSPEGPPVTGPRIKLPDGRNLAYKEFGVPKDKAKHKIVFVHGFDCCRHHSVLALASPGVIEELGVYIVSFDRPGYGESDPDPKRTVKSLALDIEQLADQLGLGSKFYVAGFSMGGQVIWSCLKYIPHRLAGATLIAPVVNYWWPGFPAKLRAEAYSQQLRQDQWTLRVAHYIPSLTYWWNTQKLFASSSVIAQNPAILSRKDYEIIMNLPKFPEGLEKQARQQGEYESLHRDLMIGFGKWEFDPMDLENPFPNKEGSVHLWMGDEDLFVPVTLQRYIAKKLPWIQYHELPGAGHLFPLAPGSSDQILKALLTSKN